LLRLVLELPRVALPVLDQARIVVSLVEVLENGGEDLRFFVRKGYPPTLRIEEVVAAGSLKERRLSEDILVRRKEPSLTAHSECDYGRGSGGLVAGVLVVVVVVIAVVVVHRDRRRVLLGERSLQLCQLRVVSCRTLLLQSRSLVDPALALVLRPERTLEHGCGGVLAVASSGRRTDCWMKLKSEWHSRTSDAMRGDICKLYPEESRMRLGREGRGSVRQESDETSEESGGGGGW